MATVMRAARLSGEAVTLTFGTSLRQAPSSAPVVVPKTTETKVDDTDTESQLRQIERTLKALEATLREQEEALMQREKVLQEALEQENARAFEEAYAAGMKKSEEVAASKLNEMLATLGTLSASLTEQYKAVMAGCEDMAVDIAFEAVCKILGDSQHTREGVAAAIRSVMRQTRAGDTLTVRVSPQAHELLCLHPELISSRLDDTTHRFIADSSIELGGCIVEHAGGNLDGRLETQLARLREVLDDARKMQTES